MPTTTPTIWLAPFKINSTDAGPDDNDQTNPQVIALTGGRFFVAWNDNGNAAGIGAPDIFGRFVGPTGVFAGGPLGGNDFIMNSFVDFTQGPPALAAGPNGGINLAYQTTSDPLFNLGEGVPVDRFDMNGAPAANPNPGPSWINSAADETAPAIASFSDGSSVVVFEDNGGGNKDLHFHIVSSTGLIGAELDVALGAGDQTDAQVATLNSSNFVTAFVTNAAGNQDIGFAIRQSDGTFVAAGTVDADIAAESDPSVAMLTGGGFVVTWTDAASDGSGTAIRARLFTSAGAPLPALPTSFGVNTSVTGDQKTSSVIGLSDGGFVVVWDDDGAQQIRGQRFGATGTAIGSQFTVAAMGNAGSPDIGLLGDGRFVVSFANITASNSDIYTAVFDPRDAVINATAGDDVFTSRIDGATVNGLGGSDTLLGQAGNDTLNGGTGNDAMTGGLGNDNFYVDSALDVVNESVGGGSDRVFASLSYTLAAGREIETLSTTNNAGVGAINLTGNSFNNTIYGNAGVNILNGGTGSDQIYGLGGNDQIYVDNVLDRAFEAVGGGLDRVFASVSFALAAGQEIETLSTTNNAGVGAINLTGNAFNNTIYGNAGINVLNGSTGNDLMSGLGGNDQIYVDSALDRAFEAVGGGLDRVFASLSFALAAGQEIETLSTTNSAGLGAVNLTGNAFNNTIFGNAGINVIKGGLGNDVLYGYGGTDYFVFDTALDAATNRDTIGDFNAVADSIQLQNAIFTLLTTTGTLAANLFKNLNLAVQDADDRILYNDTTGALFYDANGLAAGGQTQFATLSSSPTVTAADFVVI